MRSELTLEQLEANYRVMLKIRYTEKGIEKLFEQGKISGTAHLCVGQEAVSAGVMSCLSKNDYVISTHRGHGHLLAMGAKVEGLIGELLGKKSGYCKGRGGTQHISAMDINFLGSNGITGGGIPIGTGFALGLKKQKKEGIVVVFMGDGATNSGYFYESLNFASLWNIPVLYICENNLYAMSTPVGKSSAVKELYRKAQLFNIKGYQSDGMDLKNVISQTQETLKEMKENNRPAFIEFKTYRYVGHSKSDKRVYRTREEESLWENHDPISIAENYLGKYLEEKAIEKIKDEEISRIQKIIKNMAREEETDKNTILDKIYAE